MRRAREKTTEVNDRPSTRRRWIVAGQCQGTHNACAAQCAASYAALYRHPSQNRKAAEIQQFWREAKARLSSRELMGKAEQWLELHKSASAFCLQYDCYLREIGGDTTEARAAAVCLHTNYYPMVQKFLRRGVPARLEEHLREKRQETCSSPKSKPWQGADLQQIFRACAEFTRKRAQQCMLSA